MYGAYLDVAAYNNPTWDVVRRSSEAFLHSETLAWLSPDGVSTSPLSIIKQASGVNSQHNSTSCNSCNYELANDELTTLDDFILICEVSELEGPKPVISIPHHVVSSRRVDTNVLAEKLMSIDYYYSNHDPFDVSHDTQVLLSAVTEEFHAFSNYLNLYDISARGFVRPVCVAYITTNKRKLVEYFQNLRKRILNVSSYLKFGNRRIFLQDLHLYLQDLQEAKNNYVTKCSDVSNYVGLKLEDQMLSENCVRESSVINQFADNIIEIQHLLSTEKPILDDNNIADILFKIEVQVKSSFRNELYKQIKDFVRMEPTRSSKLDSMGSNVHCVRLRSILQLCSWGIVVGLSELISLQRYYKSDFPTIYLEIEDTNLLKPSNGVLAFGAHVLTNIKSNDHTINLDASGNNSVAQFEKNISEIQAIFNTLEPKTCVFDHQSTSSIELDISDDDFEDAESCDSLCASLSLASIGVNCSENSICIQKALELEEPTKSNNTDKSCLNLHSSAVNSINVDDDDSHMEYELKTNIYLNSLAKHVDFLSPDKPGYGIASVFASLHNFLDIFYSLLIGRQVMIAGVSEEEELVRSVVQALDILVPDKRLAPIAYPWCTNGIKTNDVDRYKLIGLSIPETDVKSLVALQNKTKSPVSIAYVGKNLYVGPVYSGQFLEGLRQISRVDWNDSGLLCYIQSRVLSIVSRMVLYRNILATDCCDDIESSAELKLEKGSAFANTKLHCDDVKILRYFTIIFKDVMKS